jgi:hypothetical protein
VTRGELQIQLERAVRGGVTPAELVAWARVQIVENDNDRPWVPAGEREYLQGFLEHCLFATEPRFELGRRDIEDLLNRLLANMPAWDQDGSKT